MYWLQLARGTKQQAANAEINGFLVYLENQGLFEL